MRETASRLGLARDAVSHLGALLALARREVRGNLRALAGLVILAGTGAILVVVALLLFVEAVVKALAVLIGSEVAAALIVASPFALAAALLVRLAHRRLMRLR